VAVANSAMAVEVVGGAPVGCCGGLLQRNQGDAMRTCIGEEDQRKMKGSGGSLASR
jgi:hypothetical protein